jgi:hypothetical protein
MATAATMPAASATAVRRSLGLAGEGGEGERRR